MRQKPVFTTFNLTCPYCGTAVTCQLDLTPSEFDQEHSATCTRCLIGFTFFFQSIANVVYNGLPA